MNLTDRASGSAQNAVTGTRQCVFCGSKENLGVMHLDGNEDHGEPANLAWGCKSCNAVLAAAFKQIGAGKPTNQYNPSTGVPTFAQYAWAVSNHSRGAHDEGGAIIHATPKHKRIEYARRIAEVAGKTKRERFESRWNPVAQYAVLRGGKVVFRSDDRYETSQRATDLKRAHPQEKIEFAERKNVAKKSQFEKCVESVKAEGGAHDPRAVCAAAGRRKYGQVGDDAASRGRKEASRAGQSAKV